MSTQDTSGQNAGWFERIWDRGLETFETWADYDLFRDQLDIVRDARAFEGEQQARQDAAERRTVARRTSGAGLGGIDQRTLLLGGLALLGILLIARR
jgi:hypothetical protein